MNGNGQTDISQENRTEMRGSIPCGILLAMSGGCMDAYSYMFRGHVFANAQTGNILLFGVNLASCEFAAALRYLWPILFFSGGIIISDVLCSKRKFLMVHWKQISILFEAVIMLAVAFMPQSMDAVVNMLISLACGIQVENFRKIHDNNIATTMCIGNLRSGVSNLTKFLNTHDNVYLGKVFLYFGVIAVFVIGAVIETLLISVMGSYAIFLSAALLLAALVIIPHKTSSDDENAEG